MKSIRNRKEYVYRKKYNLASSFRFGNLDNISMVGNITIGEGSYLNSGRIVSGANSKIVIGDYCEMGYNVNIISETHDSLHSTGPSKKTKEADIIIGNHVWIGTNVFIKEGVIIGDNSILGANSLVIKNVENNSIVGGVPAKHIKYKNELK